MNQKSTQAIFKNEDNNKLKNTIYTLTLARTKNPPYATTQFFINVADNDFLNFYGKNTQDWDYCIFGKVVVGISIVDKIKGVKIDYNSMTRMYW